jgi:molybdate transport system permease protein
MNSDLQAVFLTFKLASVTMLALLIIATPLAWWLSQTKSAWRNIVAPLLTLPIILPPTVLGFYLLIFLGPNGWLGQLTTSLGMGPLVFSFWGLVIGSIIYSLPFAVQPLVNSFKSIDPRLFELGATLNANPWKRFTAIALPLAKPGFYTAAILSFAHTVGEFGVILMIGGNIPGETRVLSIAIYEHVEALEYDRAHILAAGLLVFSFLILWATQKLQPQTRKSGVGL